jgi:hypothetical protein
MLTVMPRQLRYLLRGYLVLRLTSILDSLVYPGLPDSRAALDLISRLLAGIPITQAVLLPFASGC